ncbi:MAG: hypothetical protein KGJ13_10550 [Patescibacteria group bacterium]|nr:hypothetical protein [Patescibacteria group bacterium]
MKHVCSSIHGNALCDIADEVEKLFGFGITIVTIGPITRNTLYIDTRFPTWEKAYEYARELYLASLNGSKSYYAAIRK